jgi:hypothetical protein
MQRRKGGTSMDPFDQLPSYIIIPMEDDLVHTAANGYKCGDPTCYCAGDPDQTGTSTIVDGSLTYVVDETHQLN